MSKVLIEHPARAAVSFRRRMTALVCTASVLAAAPALAQSNALPPSAAPGSTAGDTVPPTAAECADATRLGAAAARDCPPGSTAGSDGDLAIALPDLLFDLFPNPRGRTGADQPSPSAFASGSSGAAGTSGAADIGGASLAAPPPAAALTPAATPPTAAPPVAPRRAISGAFVPDEVLVTVDGGVAEVGAIAAAFNLEVRAQRVSNLLGATLVRFGIPDGRPVAVVLAQLETDGRTRLRAPNHIYGLQPAASIINYAFERIALDQRNASGADVGVAVIDSAVDETHAALSGVVVESHDAMPGTPIVDRDHATSIVGLIAGVGPFRGIAPGARIFHARAFEGGRSTMDIILDAFDWSAARDVRLINMSFVGPPNDLLELACAAARARDIVLVAAAGNNGPNAPYGYPAAYDPVIAVTATDASDALMQQANRGPYVFVSAPGVDMVAPVGGGSDLVTGTSFAAAVVTGAIVNLLHARPESSAAWIEDTLATTARDLGTAGRDRDFGYGLVNYEALFQAR